MTTRAAFITGASITDVVEILRAVLRLSPQSVTSVIAIERSGAGQTP
jgi:hypothetical protein